MFADADGRGWLLNPSSLAELVTRSLKDAPADDSGNGAVAGVGYREDPGLLLSRESRSDGRAAEFELRLRELLDSVVAGVGDVDVLGGVDGDAVGSDGVTWARSPAAPAVQEPAVARELLDLVVEAVSEVD